MRKITKINIPASKSITQRAFICATISNGRCLVKNPLKSEDTVLLASGLKELGSKISWQKHCVTIEGNSGNFQDKGKKTIFMGNNGTGFRFLTTLSNFYKNEVILTGDKRMLERPVGSLAESLNNAGFKVKYLLKYGFPPVKIIPVSNELKNNLKINTEQSSQFLSSVLLCAPLFSDDLTVNSEGSPVSFPYVKLTLDVMNSFGVNVEERNNGFFVNKGSFYKATEYIVENDFSSASYFAAAAVIKNKRVKLENLFYEKSKQGDKRFLDILSKMGGSVAFSEDSVIVSGGKLRGITVDMNNMPDMVPTLSVLALFAETETIIKNIAHLRFKETDRIETVVKNIIKVGGNAVAGEDYIKITPMGKNSFNNIDIDPENDHRIAMSFALLKLVNNNINILNKKCVNKSFPDFWKEFEKLL